MPKVLLLGGTGVIGAPLAEKLAERGYSVCVTSRRERTSKNENITYIRGNALSPAFLKSAMSQKFDAVVDFMMYTTAEFRERYEFLLQNAGQYIFLSSYRVYAQSVVPIREDAPLLLDASKDATFLKTDAYPLEKARQENILRGSGYKNWTIARATIVYEETRHRLGVLKHGILNYRALKGCPVIIPKEALPKLATMTWADDAGEMISWLVLNERALGEAFTISTSESKTWAEIAGYYEELFGLKAVPVDTDAYIRAVGNRVAVLYDRLYDRAFDTAKILSMGDKDYKFLPVYDGLKRAAAALGSASGGRADYALNARLDKLTGSHIPLDGAGIAGRLSYLLGPIGSDRKLFAILEKLGMLQHGRFDTLKKLYNRFWG